jgi:hypothetical protein
LTAVVFKRLIYVVMDSAWMLQRSNTWRRWGEVTTAE